MHVLISGGGIAGPALAYWLHRRGIAVTVVEKAPVARSGGYPVDIRGSALDVLDRAGLLSRVRAAHVDTRRVAFLGAAGRPVASLRPEGLTGAGRDLEVPRGTLTAILHDAVRDDVRFRFGDSVAALRAHDHGVEVTFAGGDRRDYDLVVGADGLHSNIRRLAFGPPERHERYLGYCFLGFSLPNQLRLAHEVVMYTAPGRMAALYAPGVDTVFALLVLARQQPPRAALRRPAAQRDLIAGAFAADGWEIPRLLDAARTADDRYFDLVSQVRMPSWSRGRVGLVGDAAYAPSFLSGQGTSIALVGAYVLAGELARQADPVAAFAAYERTVRPFVARNQALVGSGSSMLVPTTARGLWLRNQALRLAPLAGRTGLLGRATRRAATALTLPEYT